MKRVTRKLFMLVVMALVLTGITPDLPIQATKQISTVEAASKIKLNKSTASIVKGKTLQLKVSGTSKKVTWKSSNTKVAAVNSNGKVTAKKAGTATISAKVSGKTYKCKVTVKAETVKISKTKLSLTVGSSSTLKITGTTKKVTWTSNKKSVATVNSKGKVTAKKAGTATITAKVNGKKYTCKVTVSKVEISKTSLMLNVGDSSSLTVKGATNTISWSSNNENVVTVNSNGVVFANNAGTATVTAKVNGAVLKCTVTVKKTVYEEPEFSVFMSSKTDRSSHWIIMGVTNRGSLPLKIKRTSARSYDRDFDTYNRNLNLVDYYKMYNNGQIIPIEYLTINPGKTEYVVFYISVPTWYDSKTSVFYLFEYDDKEYCGYSSAYYGTSYDEW